MRYSGEEHYAEYVDTYKSFLRSPSDLFGQYCLAKTFVNETLTVRTLTLEWAAITKFTVFGYLELISERTEPDGPPEPGRSQPFSISSTATATSGPRKRRD
jgi:hypothetical protein